jgi:predicted transcriptional regulator
MGKSVYSIVLSDEVVEAVDAMAYSMNTSRSNLINQILAERVSFTTPEMRMREIFSMVGQMLDGRFLPAPQNSESVMAVKTPLKFKYKPTVKYSVELSRSFSGQVGRLKVTLRTQSEELIRLTGKFFEYWSRLERKYLGKFFTGEFPCEVSPKCYTRDFYEVGGGQLGDREIARAISEYIRIFDKAITAYFDNVDDIVKAQRLCEETYKGYLQNGVTVI